MPPCFIHILQEAHRFEMLAVCDAFWETAISEYAQKLWSPPSSDLPDLEPELLHAMHTEFLRLGYATGEIQTILRSFQQTRVLQTATHVTATEGPTFLSIHQLALCQIPAESYYLVAAYSGIPFSNNAWSGCLNYGTKTALTDLIFPNSSQYAALKRANLDRSRDADSNRISLIQGRLRDARVYGSVIPEKMTQILEALAAAAQVLIPQAVAQQDFSAWALNFCTQQTRKIFNNPHIVYWDLNQVISDYLQVILRQKDHPVTRLLFEAPLRHKAQSLFAQYSVDAVMFTVAFKHKKRGWRQENLLLGEQQLEGKKQHWDLNAEAIIEGLRTKDLCPGLFLCFMILRFQNQIHCLGSFEQIEYLVKFQKIAAELQIMEAHCLKLREQKKHPSLTTGRCYDSSGTAIFPLDILLENATLPELPQTLGKVLEPLLSRFSP